MMPFISKRKYNIFHWTIYQMAETFASVGLVTADDIWLGIDPHMPNSPRIIELPHCSEQVQSPFILFYIAFQLSSEKR